jgi:RimJ/RimL family protein N-acetyltransferase
MMGTMTVPILVDIPDSLHTERLSLRPPRAGDGAALFAAVSESLPELRQFLASLPWVAAEQSIEASEAYCRGAHAKFLTRTDLPYLAHLRSSGELVACVGLHRPEWSTPKFEVGYWCRSSRLGCGYVTEGVGAIVSLAFDALSARRVELITDEENARSRRVAERCGFVLEGVLKCERRAADGSLRNTCVYARTRGSSREQG